MDKIIYIPLDERPCNYIYPQYVAKTSNCNLIVAPKNKLGNFKKSADVNELWEWVFENAMDADYAVLSMDMLVYGGIVPSRLHYLNKSICEDRINNIKKLKETNSNLKIYAFQLITRAPARDGSGEEPDYYENHGYHIYRFGYLNDKKNVQGLDFEEEKELNNIIDSIPKEFLEDFINRRNINFKSNLKTISLVGEFIDYFVIPIDDCKPYGYASDERKRIGKHLAEKNMLSKVLMYPGADEIGCTLMARAINDINNKIPKVFIDYSSKIGKFNIPSYEDRCICETLGYHIIAMGGVEVFDPKECDIAMGVNPPTEDSLRLEKLSTYNKVVLEKERNFVAFITNLEEYKKMGKIVGVADCAIPNKCDRALMQFMFEKNIIWEIDSFSGWNTSSNAFGTVLAHTMAINVSGNNEMAKEFLFLRYLEDWGYMTMVREKITEELAETYNLSKIYDNDLYEIVKTKILDELNKFMDTWLNVKKNIYIEIPWKRMFEIEIKISNTTGN